MKNISILGCGWLGKPLAVFLVSKGFALKGSTTSVDKLPLLASLKIQPFLVDISKQIIPKDFLKSDILLIAITSKNEQDFVKLISEIATSPIQKIIFISSTSVYPSVNKVMTENDETHEHPLVTIENLFRKNTHFKTDEKYHNPMVL